MTTAVEDARPTAFATVAGAMAATMAPVRDAWLLEQECLGLAAHIEAAATASDRLSGFLRLSTPPELGRQIRDEAARLGEDAATLASAVLAAVFVPDAATGETLLRAVLGRKA